MKIAAYQGSCPSLFEERLQKSKELALQAKKKGVSILCFPECFLTGYYEEEIAARENAFELEGEKFREICREFSFGDLTVIMGLNELEGDDLYNTAVVIEGGELVGRYRKNYLYQDYFKQGLEFPIFEKEGITYGIVICLDANYLEPSRILALKGAQIIFCPMFNRVLNTHPFLSAPSLCAHFIARSFENDLYFVAADTVWLNDGMQSCPGFSRIHNRNGEEIMRLEPFKEGFLIQEIEPEQENKRKKKRLLGDPSLIQILSDVYNENLALKNLL